MHKLPVKTGASRDISCAIDVVLNEESGKVVGRVEEDEKKSTSLTSPTTIRRFFILILK